MTKIICICPECGREKTIRPEESYIFKRKYRCGGNSDEEKNSARIKKPRWAQQLPADVRTNAREFFPALTPGKVEQKIKAPCYSKKERSKGLLYFTSLIT
jgi:hypothetical protein